MTEQQTRTPTIALQDRFGRRLAMGLTPANLGPASADETAGMEEHGAPRACAGVSDAEIAQLVTTALQCAMLALGDRHPEQFLHRRAAEGRAATQAALASLPHAQASDARVQDDYRKAITFQDAACDLAHEMVRAVSHYAAANADRKPSDIM